MSKSTPPGFTFLMYKPESARNNIHLRVVCVCVCVCTLNDIITHKAGTQYMLKELLLFLPLLMGFVLGDYFFRKKKSNRGLREGELWFTNLEKSILLKREKKSTLTLSREFYISVSFLFTVKFSKCTQSLRDPIIIKNIHRLLPKAPCNHCLNIWVVFQLAAFVVLCHLSFSIWNKWGKFLNQNICYNTCSSFLLWFQ